MGHREALLAAARRCLEEKGYARTTARDLVAVSGTNLASIGYHFGSKEALLNAALGQAFDEWTDQLAALVMADACATPMERAWTSWKAWLASLEEHRALLVAFTEALAQSGRTPGLREQLARRYQHVRRNIAAMVREALGGEADDQACFVIASYVIAVCDGLALQWLLDPEHTPDGDQLLQGLTTLCFPSSGTGETSETKTPASPAPSAPAEPFSR